MLDSKFISQNDTPTKQWKTVWIQNKGLILTLFLALTPLMGVRLVRFTGDEKVYLAQSLEMAQHGQWFVQSLAGQPNYYKGPLHYLLVRLGLMIFGQNLWAALYMNLLFSLIGAVALASWVREVFPKQRDWPFWAGCFFALNVGIYGHFFTSQMELELAGLFSLAFFALWRGNDLLFWLVAGFAGWSKSPLHSVLLGLSALSFWMVEGTLFSRIKSGRSWKHLSLGVLFCAAGYAPALILDTQNFIQHYYLRETLKGSNGSRWWSSLVPMVSYYLVPWMSMALVSPLEFLKGWKGGRRSWRDLSFSEKRAWKLVGSTLIPTHLFFIFYHYRLENYALPTVASSIFLILLLIEKNDQKVIWIRKWILAIGSWVGLLIAFCFFKMGHQFQLPDALWPVGFLPALWGLALFCGGVHLKEFFSKQAEGLGVWSTLGQVSLVSMLGLIFGVLGEMDLYPVRKQISEDLAHQGVPLKVSYLDIRDTIWNEWGLLSFSLGYPIVPLHQESQLQQAIEEGHLILARNQKQKDQILEFAAVSTPQYQPQFYPWKRFRVLHLDAKGIALLKQAWEQKDFWQLTEDGVMVRFFSRIQAGDPQNE